MDIYQTISKVCRVFENLPGRMKSQLATRCVLHTSTPSNMLVHTPEYVCEMQQSFKFFYMSNSTYSLYYFIDKTISEYKLVQT